MDAKIIDALTAMCKGYGGKMHGDTGSSIDIEFPSMFDAAAFAHTMLTGSTIADDAWDMPTLLNADIRASDTVTSLHSTVTLTCIPFQPFFDGIEKIV